jgi:hypothetical protein
MACSPLTANTGVMTKRVLAAFLWFGATWFGFEIVWSLTDVPRVIGPLLAAAVATLISLDPTGRFWSIRLDRRETSPRITATSRPLA